MRTQVAIIGSGPVRPAARSVAAPGRHRQRHPRARQPRTMCWRACAPACSSRARSICSTRPASARGCTPRACCTTASRWPSTARGTASTHGADRRQACHRLRPDRGDARPDGRARRRRAARRSTRPTTSRRTISTAPRRSSPTQGRRQPSASTATSSPAATAITASAARAVPERALKTFERHYPFGWLGVLADVPPADRMNWSMPITSAASRCARCARRTAAATTSSARSTTTSRPGPTSASGTSCAAGSPRAAAEPLITGPSFEKVDRAAALLRRRADALRPAVPGRRRRPHRAADRRQGAQPRRQRRALSLRRACANSIAKSHEPASTPIRQRRWRACGRRCASPGG